MLLIGIFLVLVGLLVLTVMLTVVVVLWKKKPNAERRGFGTTIFSNGNGS